MMTSSLAEEGGPAQFSCLLRRRWDDGHGCWHTGGRGKRTRRQGNPCDFSSCHQSCLGGGIQVNSAVSPADLPSLGVRAPGAEGPAISLRMLRVLWGRWAPRCADSRGTDTPGAGTLALALSLLSWLHTQKRKDRVLFTRLD